MIEWIRLWHVPHLDFEFVSDFELRISCFFQHSISGDSMIRIPTIRFISHHKRNRRQTPPGPPGLVLQSVLYPANSGESIHLEFDRDINIGSINVGQILVSDSALNKIRQGTGSATLIDSQTVQIDLEDAGSYSGDDDLLNASNDTGIVAVDDGGTWAGVSDFPV